MDWASIAEQLKRSQNEEPLVSLPVLGYAVAVTLGLGGLLWILGERDPLRFAVTLILLGPGLWAVFHHLLGLRLPLLVSGGAF